MHETILSLALNLTGAAETEQSLLELLCTAAEQEWEERLREGVTPTDCGDAYLCAAAFTAAADLLTSRGTRDAFSSFTAGAVSVSGKSAAETVAAATALRNLAARLMAPYTVEDAFCFRGVNG